MSMSEESRQCHCLALRRGSRHVTRLYDAHLAPLGLSISQYSLLSIINRRPGIRMAELGEIMVMERTTLLRALKPLLAGGWIENSRAKGEQAHTYRLTDEGRRVRDSAVPLWKAAQETLERSFELERAVDLRREALALTKVDFG
ncbi:MarR family transcriptional regulator [Rhizobium sp. PP-WC-2G-219]|nr:MarR family transcriptional regulator [Rhizobium sp. PP-WC-2G-219]